MSRFRRPAAAILAVATFWPTLVFGQAPRAGVVTTLEGNVSVTRVALPQPQPLKFKDDVFVNDKVTTGDKAIARMLLGGKAVVTVRERSSLTITEVPGKSTIDLDAGKIALAVARDKMRPGDSIEVRTPNAVAGVRGTVFVTEVIRATAQAGGGPSGVTTRFFGFQGAVNITQGGQQFTLAPNQFFSATGIGAPTLGTMSLEQRNSALSGLQPPAAHVGGTQQTASDAAMSTTAATFSQALGIVTPSETPPVSNTGTCCSVPILPGNVGGIPTPTSTATSGFSKVASGILIFGDRFERDNVQSDLTSLGRTVLLNTTTLPADLSSFGTIWYIGCCEGLLTTAQQMQLVTGLRQGRGIYLTGERPCCEALNASLTNIVRAAVVDGSGITIGNRGDIGGPYAFNPGALGGISTMPNALTTWVPDAPGGIAGVSGNRVFATGAGGIPVGAVWDSSDLVGGNGRLVVLMDVDWLSENTAPQRRSIIENIERFIDDPPSTLALPGSLFRSSGESLSTNGTFLTINGYDVLGQSGAPLLSFSGSRVDTDGDLLRILASQIVAGGGLLRVDGGAQIVQTGSDALLSARDSMLALGGHLIDVAGRSFAVQRDPDPDPISGAPTGLVFGIDRPLQPGPGAAVFEADASRVTVGGSALKIDTALLEASAPALRLLHGAALTTGNHAIDLALRAKVSIPGDALVSLNLSSLLVRQGHLVNVAGGSRLSVGDLVALTGGSTLSILNGALLSVSGGSIVNVGGALIRFTGTDNFVGITNSFAPTALIGGVPVYAPGGGFSVTTSNALAGLGTSGAIKINGVTLTPTTSLSRLTGSLVVVQGGSVKVGP